MILVYQLQQSHSRVPDFVTQEQIENFENKIHQRFNNIKVNGSIMWNKIVFSCKAWDKVFSPAWFTVDFIIYFDATFQYEFNQNKIFKSGEI